MSENKDNKEEFDSFQEESDWLRKQISDSDSEDFVDITPDKDSGPEEKDESDSEDIETTDEKKEPENEEVKSPETPAGDKSSDDESEKDKRLNDIIEVNEKLNLSLEIKLSTLIKQYKVQEKQYNELLVKKESLIEDLRNKKSEMARIDAELKTSSEKLKTQSSDVDELSETRNQLRDKVLEYETDKSNIHKDLVAKREEEDRLTGRIEDLKRTLTQLESQRFEIDENTLEIENRFNDLLKSFTDEVSISKETLQEINKDIYDRKSTLHQLTKQSAEKTAELAKIKNEIGTLNAEKNTIRKIIDSLGEQKEIIENDIEDLKEREITYKTGLQEIKSKYDHLENKKLALENKLRQLIDNADSSYEDSLERKALLEEEVRRFEDQSRMLQDKVTGELSKLQDIRKQSSVVENEHENLSSKISDLTSLERTLKKKIDSLDEEKKKKQHEVDNLSEELIARQNSKALIKLKELEEKIEAAQDKYEKISGRLKEVRSENETAQDKKEDLTVKISELSSFEKVLKTRIDYYQKEIQKNKELLSRLVGEVKQKLSDKDISEEEARPIPKGDSEKITELLKKINSETS